MSLHCAEDGGHGSASALGIVCFRLGMELGRYIGSVVCWERCSLVPWLRDVCGMGLSGCVSDGRTV